MQLFMERWLNFQKEHLSILPGAVSIFSLIPSLECYQGEGVFKS